MTAKFEGEGTGRLLAKFAQLLTPTGAPRIPELGAIPNEHGVLFRVWSTAASKVFVRLYQDQQTVLQTVALSPQADGIFEAEVAGVASGALYRFVLDDQEVGDPYAWFLPFGVLGPARVEPRSMPLPRGSFVIPPLTEAVIYELHIGTFTPEGTWLAAAGRLEHLKRLGINVIEVMPVSAFNGERGWGYDGAAPFAPHARYGEPEELRAFLGKAHQLGLAAILDVVYNHFGPVGNYLQMYSPEYFTSEHKTAWGDAPAFARPHMRNLVLESARHWLDDLGFDGLRLDATHAMVDLPQRHVLADLAATAKGLKPPRLIIAEDDRNEPLLVTEQGLDAIWADDFHHALHVLLTSEQDGYYKAYAPGPATLAKTIECGWLYTGETFAPWNCARGKPADELEASRFVYCLQNHDQIGNRALGTRMGKEAGVDAQCAAAMLLLFLPMVPLIFMGEEWAASTPFLYFTDHDGRLGEEITKGRRNEFSRFEMFSDPAVRATIPDPQSEETFKKSQLRWEELEMPEHARVLRFYTRMLALRKSDHVLASATRDGLTCRTGKGLLVVTRREGGAARTLLLNYGYCPVPMPDEFAVHEVLLSSVEKASPGEIAARSALLLRSS